jgi:hypothetical protein
LAGIRSRGPGSSGRAPNAMELPGSLLLGLALHAGAARGRSQTVGQPDRAIPSLPGASSSRVRNHQGLAALGSRPKTAQGATGLSRGGPRTTWCPRRSPARPPEDLCSSNCSDRLWPKRSCAAP